MTSFAYRLGRGSHKAVNVVAAGSVVAVAGVVHGTKVATRSTGQFGRDYVAGWQSTGGVSDTLRRWMNQPAAAEQPKPHMKWRDIPGTAQRVD